MDGSAIISALLLGLGCVKITLERPAEVLLLLGLLKYLHYLAWQALQPVEDFQILTKIFRGGSEQLMKSKLDLLTYISNDKELSNALLMRYLRRLSLGAISIHQSIEAIASAFHFK